MAPKQEPLSGVSLVSLCWRASFRSQRIWQQEAASAKTDPIFLRIRSAKKWKTMEHVQLAFTSVYNLVDSVGLFLFKQTIEVLKAIIPVKQLQGSPVDQERVCSTGLSGFGVKHDNSGHVFLRHARTDMLLNAFIYMSMFSFFQDF